VEVPLTQKRLVCSGFVKVSEGTRTRDRLDHNRETDRLNIAECGFETFGHRLVCRSMSGGFGDRIGAIPNSSRPLAGASRD
jgi:hypothetical protein